MRNLLLVLLCAFANSSFAQEVDDIHLKSANQKKYSYTHENFVAVDGSASAEEWVHVRSGDLTGSVEMSQKKQMRISLNSTASRLLGMKSDSLMGKFLNKIQVEGRADSKRADYALLGIETPVSKHLTGFAAGVLNDANSLRPLIGTFCYWAPESYSGVLLYMDENAELTNYSVSVRNHVAIGKAYVEANVSGKVKDGHTMYGGQLKGGLGVVSMRYEYAPQYEGSALDRSLYGVDLALNF